MSHAFCLDSLLNLPAMGIPVINYSPESSWEFGAAAQGYFRLPNQERTSIVQLDGTYSLKHQWYINAQGTLYFGTKTNRQLPTINRPTWQLQFRAGYSDRPATYYGTYHDSYFANEGNMGIGMLRKGVPYQLQRGYLKAQAPIYVSKYIAVGPLADILIARFAIQNTYTTVNPLAQIAVCGNFVHRLVGGDLVGLAVKKFVPRFTAEVLVVDTDDYIIALKKRCILEYRYAPHLIARVETIAQRLLACGVTIVYAVTTSIVE